MDRSGRPDIAGYSAATSIRRRTGQPGAILVPQISGPPGEPVQVTGHDHRNPGPAAAGKTLTPRRGRPFAARGIQTAGALAGVSEGRRRGAGAEKIRSASKQSQES